MIIPTLNERRAVGRALGCTAEPGVERIVVDGGSTDGTVEAAQELGAEAVIRSEPGRARQLDGGYRACKGDVLLFLHADTRLDPGWRGALVRALEDPDVAGGAFRLRFESERRAYRWVERGAHARCRLLGLPYGDQGLFARRAVLDAGGGLPDVPIFEDLDLARSISRRGRLVLLRERAWTSPRRYERNGVLRTVARNNLALAAYLLRLDRARVLTWYRRRPRG